MLPAGVVALLFRELRRSSIQVEGFDADFDFVYQLCFAIVAVSVAVAVVVAIAVN